MLTMTYGLISLAIEQQRLHYLLSKTRYLLSINSANRLRFDPASWTSNVVGQLTILDAFYHKRRVETCVIPAVRNATKEADSLLAEMESLNIGLRRILDAVKDYAQPPLLQGPIEVVGLCSLIELYCTNLLDRMEKEEKQLLPLANRVISNDEWFALGAKFLAMDGDHYTNLHEQREDDFACATDAGAQAMPDQLMSLLADDNMYVN